MTRTDDTFVPDYPGLLRLDGRRFVVLGAGQGIGRQASHALASVAARVACVDVEPDLAADIAGEVDGIPMSGNAYDRDDVERMFTDAARSLGGIDGVVDIIGMARYADLTEMSDEDWDWHFDIVLRHAFLAHAVRRGRARCRRAAAARWSSCVGVGDHVRAAALGVRRGQGRSDVARPLRRGRARAARHPGERGRTRCGVDPRVSAFLGEEGLERNIANTPLRRVAQPADIAAPRCSWPRISRRTSRARRSRWTAASAARSSHTPWPICDRRELAGAVRPRVPRGPGRTTSPTRAPIRPTWPGSRATPSRRHGCRWGCGSSSSAIPRWSNSTT